MKKSLKKVMAAALSIVLSMALTVPAFAHTTPSNETDFEYVGERTIEVDTYEDFLKYRQDPQYKYTFIIANPPVQQPRYSNCFQCGKQTLTMDNYRSEVKDRRVKGCPYNPSILDHFFTYGNSYDLNCYSCGYRETIKQADTYNAICYNYEGADYETVFEVRKNWTLSGGYEIHECWATWN